MLTVGIITAMVSTLIWITAQTAWMHVRPARSRLAAMTVGYLASLPLTYLVFRILMPRFADPSLAPVALGLTHAYVLGLLLYLLFVECFYHVERSVTLRLLVEILERTPPPTLEEVQGDYNLDHMVSTRLELLHERKFLSLQKDRWVLDPKGRKLCRAMAFSCWLFQSKTQDERL